MGAHDTLALVHHDLSGQQVKGLDSRGSLVQHANSESGVGKGGAWYFG